MKELFGISAIMAMILLGGCGNEDTTCRIDVQRDIDKGEFDSAISKLNGACKTAFNENDRLYNLGTAYMGKAGYGVSDVIKVMVEADEDNSNDSFTTFTKSISKNKKGNSLDLLGQAKAFFLRSLDPSITDTTTLFNKYCSSTSANFDDPRISNACFYVGFNEVIRTSVTLTHLTKDLNTTLEAINNEDEDKVPLDMKASVDALAWATKQPLPNKSKITASEVTIKGIKYKHLVIDLNNTGTTFYRLADNNASDENSSTLLTDGYCDTNGDAAPCEGIENTDGSIDMRHPNAKSCYACPISFENNSSESVVELLVETLNNGTDSIISISNDPDIEESIQDFKKEITGEINGTVTIDDIIKYLNANK